MVQNEVDAPSIGLELQERTSTTTRARDQFVRFPDVLVLPFGLSVMHNSVLMGRDKLKVFQSVILSIFIDVMDLFPFGQRAPYGFRHHESVLLHVAVGLCHWMLRPNPPKDVASRADASAPLPVSPPKTHTMPMNEAPRAVRSGGCNLLPAPAGASHDLSCERTHQDAFPIFLALAGPSFQHQCQSRPQARRISR